MSGWARWRRWGLILAPTLGWLLVGALVAHPRGADPKPTPFCEEASALVERALSDWTQRYGDELTPARGNRFVVFVSRRIVGADFDAEPPTAVRSAARSVARELARAQRVDRSASPHPELVAALERLDSAVVRACPGQRSSF